MSTLTITDVTTADPAALSRAAFAWTALAAEIDNAFEQHAAGQKRLSGAGKGQAHRAAVDRLALLAAELNGAYQPARRLGQILQDHASQVSALQAELDRALATATIHGLLVDDRTGAVRVPPGLPATSVDAMRTLAAEVESAVVSVLRRATTLDARTTKQLGVGIPVIDSGFGYKPASRLDRAAVAAMTTRSPDEVYAWWQGLTPQQQEWALSQHPDLVGGLNGVPCEDRDRANRLHLANLLRQPGAHPGLAGVQDTLAGLDDAYLLGIDGTGDGRAIIAIGNPDRATHTAVFIPGAGSSLHSVPGDVGRVVGIERAAEKATAQPDDVAVVYWLGYDPPSILEAADEQPSRDGGAALAPFVDGLHATHQPGAAHHLSVLGHSYGSTVIAEAAINSGLRVDDIIVVGSPGMHAEHASELNIDPRHVWAGIGDDDLIYYLGDLAHGKEPTMRSFGANRFQSHTEGHSGYWEEGTDGLDNQVYIITGQYDRVTLYYGELPT